jgi:hypothetical protein
LSVGHEVSPFSGEQEASVFSPGRGRLENAPRGFYSGEEEAVLALA